ncbi:hypothetical protein OSCI_920008 [Kamptonema sp. PCC 6506]|nr:hypothetical protein OSCI_920008 [Kamptonema sp. PCC 6506]
MTKIPMHPLILSVIAFSSQEFHPLSGVGVSKNFTVGGLYPILPKDEILRSTNNNVGAPAVTDST